jgi:hypothetical protein
VIVNLSETASNMMLNALGEWMNGGSLEILSDRQHLLAVLKLSNPAAMEAVGGTIELNEIAESAFARLLRRDGSEVFSCDVGDRNSDAVIKLTTTAINQGGPVRIDSFRLAMP